MSKDLDKTGQSADVARFLERARTVAPAPSGRRARLIFGVDATMSRQPTWDLASGLQAEMFEEAARIGGLDVQLIYFRGFRECRASAWQSDPTELGRVMSRIRVAGGRTQIGRVLAHARKSAKGGPGGAAGARALVYVGDAMEEDADGLCDLAGELGLLGLPVFTFHEGRDPAAEAAFREIARLSKGAYCRFDAGSAAQLRALLRGAALYAAGGRRALETSDAQGARLLLTAMKR